MSVVAKTNLLALQHTCLDLFSQVTLKGYLCVLVFCVCVLFVCLCWCFVFCVCVWCFGVLPSDFEGLSSCFGNPSGP